MMLTTFLKRGSGRGSQWLNRLTSIRNRYFLAADLGVLLFTPWLGILMRMDGAELAAPYLPSVALYTLVALGLRLAVFYGLGLYRRYWRYASVDDLMQIVLASALGTVLVLAVFYLADRFSFVGPPVPRSLPLIDAPLCFLFVCASRFSVRFGERVRRRSAEGGRPVLIAGAGETGQIIVKELQANPRLNLQPVGFLDDDPAKQGMHILSLPVFGSLDDLPRVAAEQGASQLIIAMSRPAGQRIRELMALCEEAKVSAQIIPAMDAILGGQVSVSRLRKVQIEDLLRREPIRTEVAAVAEMIRGRRVLVTGGGGSIGSELCRQVLQWDPAELTILGHGENSIFECHAELQRLLQSRTRSSQEDPPEPVLRTVIADVRDATRIRAALREVKPDLVFHAAAHKHVPLMEQHPSEAVSNNVLGTQNVVDASLACGVERFVLISTDKAVNPTSVMGATKRVAELLVLRAARESGKAYCAVRFGNVLGSRGSVLLTFKRQIAEGGPVTVSDERMMRYFMTIPEAVQLVLQAAVLGEGGEVFVLDMGQPVRIVDLARDLIELSGLEVGRDIDIVFTGTRPGEKLYEELFRESEKHRPTRHEKVLISTNASAQTPPDLNLLLEDLESASAANDDAAVRLLLRRLVPDYQSPSLLQAAGSQDGDQAATVLKS